MRDFIHVLDIAGAHIKVCLFKLKKSHVFNLGTGKGHIKYIKKTHQKLLVKK